MHINLRRVEIGVPEPFLQLEGTHAPLRLVGGKGVSQRVTAHLLGDAGLAAVARDQLAHPALGDGIAVPVEKQAIGEDVGPDRLVAPQRLNGLLLQRDRARHHAFAFPDLQHVPFEVDVIEPQGTQLRNAHAGLQEDLEDGVVARLAAGQGEQLGVLIGSQVGATGALFVGGLHTGYRRLGNECVVFEKAEILPQGRELAGTGDAGELPAAEVGQVFGQIDAFDLVRSFDYYVRLVDPGDELADVGLIGADGGWTAVLAG